MDFKKSVYDSVDWIHLAQHMDNWQFCEHGSVLLGSRNGGQFFDYLSEY
jgi:hypothetical protein